MSSYFGTGKKQEGKTQQQQQQGVDDDDDDDKRIEENSNKSVTGPKIVKTTTKQLMVKDKEGVTENIEEKIENLTSGEVQVSTQINKVNINYYYYYYYHHK